MWLSSWTKWRTRVRPESVPDRSLRCSRPYSARRSGRSRYERILALVDDRALGAVHRLERERLALGLDEEHVVPVEIPVAGLLPELLVDQHRGADLVVAAPVLQLAHRRLERPPDPPALGVPEGRPGADVVEAEQVEGDAQAPVVALAGLLAAPQELVELLLGLPDRPVDPLQHRPLLVAPPVGTGDREELEGADRRGRLDVGSLAQVAERPVLVEAGHRERLAGCLSPRGEVIEDLHLVGLAGVDGRGPGGVEGQLLPDEGVRCGDAGRHPLLDGREVLRRQRARQVEVVVEAVVDRRADAELRAGEELEHGLGHDVGGGVAHGVERGVRSRVEQLVGRASFGRLERLLDLDCLLVAHSLASSGSTKPPVPAGRGADASRGSTRLRLDRRVPAGRSRGRANGRIPGRFTGRSRVVPTPRVCPTATLSRGSRLSWGSRGGRVPLGAFVIWWAVEDLNLWPHACQACALTN